MVDRTSDYSINQLPENISNLFMSTKKINASIKTIIGNNRRNNKEPNKVGLR